MELERIMENEVTPKENYWWVYLKGETRSIQDEALMGSTFQLTQGGSNVKLVGDNNWMGVRCAGAYFEQM